MPLSFMADSVTAGVFVSDGPASVDSTSSDAVTIEFPNIPESYVPSRLTKICTVCGVLKSVDSTSFLVKKASRDGFSAHCKSCDRVKKFKFRNDNREKYLAWRKKNYESRKDHLNLKNRENLKKSRLNNPDLWKSRGLKDRYGISLEDYNIMFSNQQGCCAICGTHQSSLKWRLGVDHNHATGVVRSLLCRNCNAAIGLAKENTEILKSMISYLEKHGQ